MIIWSGLGFLVPVIVFATCLVTQIVGDQLFGDGYYSSHSWMSGAAVTVGGVLTSWLGYHLKSVENKNARILEDVETGERFQIGGRSHSIFFVPMHWAGNIVAVLGVVLAMVDRA